MLVVGLMFLLLLLLLLGGVLAHLLEVVSCLVPVVVPSRGTVPVVISLLWIGLLLVVVVIDRSFVVRKSVLALRVTMMLLLLIVMTTESGRLEGSGLLHSTTVLQVAIFLLCLAV